MTNSSMTSRARDRSFCNKTFNNKMRQPVYIVEAKTLYLQFIQMFESIFDAQKQTSQHEGRT